MNRFILGKLRAATSWNRSTWGPAARHREPAVDVVEEIAGIELWRSYNLGAPNGVNGRNSDNTMIRRELGWEPSMSLRDGMERTYRWIHDEYIRKYGD